MTEILLLGTFHFMEEPIDFYSLEAQKELQKLSNKLQKFNPDTIAVEAEHSSQQYIDSSYEKFCLKDLSDIEKMKRETLGEIYIHDKVYPIVYHNETVQIGYRLGKMLAHSKIYAIDSYARLDMTPMRSNDAHLLEAKKRFKEYSATEPKASITELIKYLNDEKWINLHHGTYIQANAVQADRTYSGTQMVAAWYERNLRIFANIQRLAMNSKRLFIIYGAGHLKLLKQLIEADNNLKLVDVREYI
ncbi:MAG: hypothetical protein E7637_03835 [Ruminococcaceae bacterium]|nr:hypothetical protein [Oscillospiraceae bacterium]